MVRNVLIVDDSIVARMAIKGALKDSGASLSEASCGEDALGLVEAGLEPDLVFLDLTMPGIGGAETLRSLKERRPGLRVVVVTADQQARTLEEIRALGVYAILRKPAERSEILQSFERAMADGGR